jgi:hypothetical protein
MIKRYTAEKDTTITNAYGIGNISRATGSNMGAADSLEVFALYGNQSVGSVEKSRILVQFPIDSIISDRASGDIPSSGNVNFYIKMYDVAHVETTPKKYTLEISPVTSDWDEGHGLDLDTYLDPGIGSYGLGANWINARSGSSGPVAWGTEGGDYAASPRFSQYFEEGIEDLEVDITSLVEEWIDGTKDNYGVGISLTSSQENQTTSTISYFTKKFSARSSEYYFARPIIEARWDSSVKDQRDNFFLSSSNASSEDNLNTIYFYNYVRGQLKDLPGYGQGSELFVRVYESRSAGSEITTTPSSPITGGWVDTGVYSASLAVNWSGSGFYDRWSTETSGGTTFHTGCVKINNYPPQTVNTLPTYVINISNLQDEYGINDCPRLRVYTRQKNWRPNIYTVARQAPILNIVEDMYYRVVRTADDLEVVPFMTGSENATRLSYDASGSYFDFDMSILEPDYGYAFEFAINYNGKYLKKEDSFRFRVASKGDY